MKKYELVGVLLAVALCCSSRAESQWLLVSPTSDVTSFVTTSDAIFAGAFGNGVTRSTDQGMTWHFATAGIPTHIIRALAASGDRIYAGTDSGVFVSTNRGDHWSAINQGLSDLRVYSLAARDSLVFAGTMSGIFRSADSGEHWTKVDLPSGYMTLIYAFVMNGSTMYAGTASYHGTVFHSTDAGITWSSTSGLGNVWALAIIGPRVIAGTDNGIRISRNDGATWESPVAGPSHRIVKSLFVHQGDLLAGTKGGLFASTDSAATWMSLSSGLSDTVVAALTVVGQTIIGGTNGGIWTRAMPDLNVVPAAPLLGAPANGAVDRPRTLTLQWGKPDLTTTFHLQVAADSTFVNGVFVDTAAYPDTTFRVDSLKVSERYFWRAAAANVHGAGSPSAAWSFTTISNAPPPPSLAWPAANGWVYAYGNGYAWHPVPGATSYRYQVARDTTFASPVVDSTVTDTTGYSRLTQMGLYYWRVQTRNEVGPGKFSDIRFFAAAEPPILATPLYGASQVPTGIALRWHPVPEATGYRVTVALGESWTGAGIVFNALVTDTSSTVEGLHENATYCWQVHARYDPVGGPTPSTTYVEGPASSIGVFDTRTNGAREIFPMLRNTQTVYAYSRTHYYESGGKEWVVDTGTVAYIVNSQAYLNDSTAIWTLSESSNLQRHHWKMDQGNVLLYDSTYRLSLASTVTLTEMLTGNHELLCESRVWHFPRLPDTSSTPQWSGREPVMRFWQDTSRIMTQFQVPPDTSKYQVLHFAAGRGLVDWTSSYVSGEGGITTIQEVARWRRNYSVTEVAPSEKPQAAVLLQNYPNPFNPSTTIRYGLPARFHVMLTVFNTLGQQVAVLQNGEQEAGYHEVRFDARNIPSGVYFYRLQAGSFTETKRLLLLR